MPLLQATLIYWHPLSNIKTSALLASCANLTSSTALLWHDAYECRRDKDSKKKKSKSGDAGSPSAEERDEDGDDGGNEDGEVEWMTDTSAAAAQKRAQEQLTTAMAGMVTQGNIEAEQDAARKREEKRLADEEAARKVSSDFRRSYAC